MPSEYTALWPSEFSVSCLLRTPKVILRTVLRVPHHNPFAHQSSFSICSVGIVLLQSLLRSCSPLSDRTDAIISVPSLLEQWFNSVCYFVQEPFFILVSSASIPRFKLSIEAFDLPFEHCSDCFSAGPSSL
jgi:hypothetical protein